MTIFKSRQVNLDPEPWFIAENGSRYAVDAIHPACGDPDHLLCQLATWKPRREFEPTRDPFPWTCEEGSCRSNAGPEGHYHCTVWAPRERFDHPVNPILAMFREDRGTPTIPQEPLAYLHYVQRIFPIPDFTPEQIDHARRVLTRLAEWKEATS